MYLETGRRFLCKIGLKAFDDKCFILLGWFIFSCAGPIFAQAPAALKKQGDKLYEKGRWKEAAASFNQYQAVKPGDAEVLTHLGVCYYHLHQSEQAQRLLEFVKAQNPASRDLDLLFFWARTLHGRQDFERAIPAYKAFLAAAPPEHPSRDFCADNILRCSAALQMIPSETVALVENIGNVINSEGDEFAPLPSVNYPGRLYYSAARPGCVGGQRNERGYEDENNGNWCSDMFIARQSNSGWEDAGSFGGLLNTARSESVLDFSADGKVLFYSRGFTLFSGEMLLDTAGLKDEYKETPPVFEGPVQMEEGDAAPFFFNDSTLLFASRRSGGFGGLDLYYTIRQKGIWAAPQNLGTAINSAYDETTPFLASDGRTLYFSANHQRTMGGFDIFKTVFDTEKRTWSTPKNLGMPVNSPNDDAFFRLAADGNTAFFASDRLESYGRRDLYIVYFKEQQPEQSTANIAWFSAAAPPGSGAAAATASVAAPARTVYLPVLHYTTDRDVLSAENLAILDTAARVARAWPAATIQISAHTDETGAAKFDLYYGIKRAEAVGKALTERGLPAARILLKSGGPQYPLARNARGAAPDPEGRRLNRRIEIRIAEAAANLPPALPKRPEVAADLALNGAARYDEQFAGLSYKVESVVARQLLNNDALAMFGDVVIESQPGSGTFRYMVGFLPRYADAAQLCKELQAQGFATATVVAYLNGLRIGKAEAVGLLKKYPDLAGFIRG